MRNREKLHEWIDRYNNSDLSGEELVIFLEMMNNDYRVREEVLLDNELNSVLRETDIMELRKKIRKICSEYPVKKNYNPRIILMAATMVILLSMEYAIFYLTSRSRTKTRSEYVSLQKSPWQKEIDKLNPGYQFPNEAYSNFHVEKSGSILSVDHVKGYAYDLFTCFQPNKILENLIGTTRAGNFRMLKPVPHSSFTHNNTICFLWKTSNPQETSLIIENNRGIVVYESDFNFSQSVFLRASFLDAGLFYYKIVQKDEAIYFGKFTVQ